MKNRIFKFLHTLVLVFILEFAYANFDFWQPDAPTKTVKTVIAFDVRLEKERKRKHAQEPSKKPS
jgi:hypothetical protein